MRRRRKGGGGDEGAEVEEDVGRDQEAHGEVDEEERGTDTRGL